MQHSGAGHGVRARVGGVHNVVAAADTAAADDRHVHGFRHGLDQFKVHTLL